jgi:hypothetical protein
LIYMGHRFNDIFCAEFIISLKSLVMNFFDLLTHLSCYFTNHII